MKAVSSNGPCSQSRTAKEPAPVKAGQSCEVRYRFAKPHGNVEFAIA
jgi:hypothetical protein